MNNHYTLEDKPNFVDGDLVYIDLRWFAKDFNPPYMPATIVGKSITNIIDMWLVEFNTIISSTYPFSVVAVPHTCIFKTKPY